ncbi:hypothetical protein [Nocardia macrotermitis]|uniref:hypothetical protein n=1 Tax=Nocardia macrotermitis TaxID=2585198 RepID=UPI001295909D|nr:hypothetical protein [Nocardia macrotermitis]
MRKPEIVKYALAVAAATAGLLGIAPVAGNAPAAQAFPIVEGVQHFGPVNSYAMSDSANCYIDYTMWIARDPAKPSRVVGHLKPLGIRATIPGLPVPPTCTATLIVSTCTDRDVAGHPVAPGRPSDTLGGLFGHTVHLNADRTGGRTTQVDLPYQRDAKAILFNVIPQSYMYPVVSYGAMPIVPPTPATAFNLR